MPIYWVQIIRAFRNAKGVTNIYNYRGSPVDSGPIRPLIRTVIDKKTVRWTDSEKKKPEKKKKSKKPVKEFSDDSEFITVIATSKRIKR